jgi:ankyrin repeat protein
MNVNVSDSHVGSPLKRAALAGNIKMLDILLCAEADVSISGGEYSNALQAASYNGSISIVTKFLTETQMSTHEVTAMAGPYRQPRTVTTPR